MCPEVSEVFQMKAEKAEKSKKKGWETWTKFESREETILKGSKHESVQYYYVLIFFRRNEVYNYHVMYIADTCSYLYSTCRHPVP